MTIGNQLKKARQKKQVALDEVYQKTRIHSNVLNALEEDRFKQILNPTYARSFLKEYATYLGLDVKSILSEYDKLFPQERPKIAESAPKKRSVFGEVDLTKIAKYAGVIAVSILAIIILISLIRGVARGINNISRQRALQTKQLKLVKAQEPVKVAPAKSLPAKERIQKAPQKSGPKPISRPSEKIAIGAKERLRLTVTATDDVWIQLKVDGKMIFQNVLKKGTSEQWEADSSFTIWTGNAGAMQFSLNGNDLGAPGKGVKKGIVVTREGIKKKG